MDLAAPVTNRLANATKRLSKMIAFVRARGPRGCLACVHEASDVWLSDHYLDRRFDKKHSVDTIGIVRLPADIRNDPNYREPKDYEQAPGRLLDRLIGDLRIDYCEFVFVDLGCGKGKALLHAARRPFRRVIGVDISPDLIRIANANLAGCRSIEVSSGAIELHCADAANFPLPEDDNLVLFLYDPFGAPVMRDVLEGLRQSLIRRPREVRAIYISPFHRDIWDASGFLELSSQARYSCVYRNRRAD
jgi:SAM-dependent methyltransferase